MSAILRKMRRCAASLAVVAALSGAVPARGGAADNEKADPDGRLEGYKENVSIEGGTGGTITFFLLLMGLTMGVMFMNAKRSHLD